LKGCKSGPVPTILNEIFLYDFVLIMVSHKVSIPFIEVTFPTNKKFIFFLIY